MDVQNILVNLQIERFEVFKSQNLENGDFDVVFEIDGKKLYAHKFMLCPISTTFKSMLSDRWTKPDEPIKIEGYTFENFKEFLTFIYSGKCQLTDANISAMVDIVEFYGIKTLKNACEEYLIKTKMNPENVFQMMEFASKYAMEKFKTFVNNYIKENLIMILKCDQFLFLQKSAIKDFVESTQETTKQAEIFEAVYKWAENQALEKQKFDQSLDLNETVKNELSEILPLIKFEKMNSVFFIKFVVKKSFLFSGDQLSDILWARNRIYVKIIDGHGKMMQGEIKSDEVEKVASVIESVKDLNCIGARHGYRYWNTKQPKPSTPSKLIKNDKTEWYLIYDRDGDLAVKKRSLLGEDDYLLAEMSAENGFELSDDSKIESF